MIGQGIELLSTLPRLRCAKMFASTSRPMSCAQDIRGRYGPSRSLEQVTHAKICAAPNQRRETPAAMISYSEHISRQGCAPLHSSYTRTASAEFMLATTQKQTPREGTPTNEQRSHEPAPLGVTSHAPDFSKLHPSVSDKDYLVHRQRRLPMHLLASLEQNRE